MDNLINEAILQTMAGKNEYSEKNKSNKIDMIIKDDNKYVGMCYVPMQTWEELYDEETAYKAGTAFPCLNKPFMGGGK